jgi:AAA15 family ATPase/GTPase
MDLLEKIKITNFRGFDEKGIEIDGLSKFNIFVGKNNCGKTSILEAMFISLGASNSMLPNNINVFRELYPSAQNLKYLFYMVSFNNKPHFDIEFVNKFGRKITLIPRFEYPQIRLLQNQNNQFQNNMFQNNQVIETIVNRTSLSQNIIGLDVDFSINKKGYKEQLYKSQLVFDAVTGIPLPILPKNYSEELKATFITTNKIENADLSRFTNIVKKQEQHFIENALRCFDDRILSVNPLPGGIFFGLKKTKELVPSNVMGDGVRRFLNIITAVGDEKNSYLCIDEIENGLHYSSQKLLLRSLLKFSESNNVQLFITTHNVEILKNLKEVLEEDEMVSMRDYAKIFDIAKTQNAGFQSYRYNFDDFKILLENETEIRR